LRGVIERDWGRQLAQKRHNLPASQNRPSGPWVEPHSPSRWKHFRKGTKRRVSRAQPRFVQLVFGSHSQDRSPPATSSSNKVRCAIPCRFSFPPEPVASVLCSPRATPPGFGSTAGRSPKKVAARLRNPGEPRTLRPSLCLGR
jgi:hypothetical protein